MDHTHRSDQDNIRAQRLRQLFWSIEFSLSGITLLLFYFDPVWYSVTTAIVMVLLTSVLFYINAKRLDAAAIVLISILALYTTLLMWSSGGLSDESVFAFPCLLAFSALLGNRKIFLLLLSYFIVNLLLLGYANSAEWMVSVPSKGNLSSAALITVILLLTAFCIWLLSSDLRNTLMQLSAENERVTLSERRIQHLVNYDSLTNLPNRVLAKDRFEHAQLLAEREGTMTCLMFLDLDKFKTINDSFGHSSGDFLLTEIARSLKKVVRNTDTVCRQGGDEFLVILESISSEQQISSIAEKILEEVRSPIEISGVSVTSSLSIGIAVAPTDGNSFDAILQKADMAMYYAKDHGRNNYRFYNSEMEQNAEHGVQLLSAMRRAIAEKQFTLFFQPKIDLKSGKVIGAEALIRWEHPKEGMIAPQAFIPLAESSGLIIELGEWIIQEACHACKRWAEHGFVDLSVAVNVAALQLKRGNLLTIVENALVMNQLPPEKLELELTESTVIDDSEKLRALLTEIRTLGVKLSIDDFGTGYSNLGYLKKMEVGILKIDRSFISRLLVDDQDKAIIEAISHMAASLKLKIVAEGVEDKETADAVTAMKCDYAQGFYWAPALPENEFIDYVKKENAKYLSM